MGSKSSKKHANKSKTLIISLAAVLVIILALSGVFAIIKNRPSKAPAPEEYTLTNEKNPVAMLEMEDLGFIVMELYPDVAPNTVANFISLANSGYYDGLIFHRVIPGFMIQGGDPAGTGMGGPGYSIKDEFTNAGFINNLSHERGVLSMARSSLPDSAGSQFFIMHQDTPGLDGNYAAFGKVVYGMEAVDAIATTPTNESDRPLTDRVIKSIRVDTKGETYPLTKIGG